MSLRIRPATVDDATPVSRLTLALLPLAMPDPAAPEARDFIRSQSPEAVAGRIMAPDFNYLVAEAMEPTGLAGFIAIRGGSHLYHLFVDSGWQGRGVARTLWNEARQGSRSTRFTVNATPAAVPVYERFGFRACATEQHADGLVFVPMVAFLGRIPPDRP